MGNTYMCCCQISTQVNTGWTLTPNLKVNSKFRHVYTLVWKPVVASMDSFLTTLNTVRFCNVSTWMLWFRGVTTLIEVVRASLCLLERNSATLSQTGPFLCACAAGNNYQDKIKACCEIQTIQRVRSRRLSPSFIQSVACIYICSLKPFSH